MGILLIIAIVLVILAIVGGIALSPWLWLVLIAAALILLLGSVNNRT